MNPIKQFFVLVLSLFLFQAVEAASESRLTFEPLFGIETALVRFPEPSRYVTRTTYGARVLYGTTPLSGELEVTEAQSRKDYPDLDQKVEDKSQRLSLGVRSTLPLGTYLGIYGRLGARASQGETKVTTAGVSETHDNPLQFDPYAGAGLQFAFSNNFALNAGVTLIRNDDDHYDSQYTLGLTARFGNL
ncbi:MAG: porin family protein [Bdellovibrionales bacterium]|nr:porin family protein [Bdellovibrionales bacterium]